MGFVSVVLVAILLATYAFVNRDRPNAGTENAPTPVLVATEPIPKGTPGSIVVANGMYRATVSRPQERQVGAISDPSYLRGRASFADIHLGQQITEANFPARG